MRTSGRLLLVAVLLASDLAQATPGRVRAEDLIKELKQSKQSLEATESEKRKILGSLYEINKRMKKISRDKGALTDQLIGAQANVKGLARIIATLESQIAEQRTQLRRRLRALYKLSGEGYLGTLFSQTSATDLDRTLRFIKVITDQDYRLIRGYQENIAKYKRQRHELDRNVKRLVKIEGRIKTQEGLLADEHRAKSTLVSDLDSSKVREMARLSHLRNEGKKLAEDEIAESNLMDLFKPSFFERKGQLIRPLEGQVIQDFGLITDEKFRTQVSHKGWYIAASPGSPLQTVFEGRVAFQDWVPGYGFLTIVDHGDHYFTLYAHLSRFAAKTGDNVKRGQTIGFSGASSRSFGPGLYFEIRHFSEPENPANWIASKNIPVVNKEANSGTSQPTAAADAQRGVHHE